MTLRIGPWRARLGFGLAAFAIIALLFSQAGLIWHAMEHLAAAGQSEARGLTSLSATAELTDAGKVSAEASCLKCLEGASHATALVGGAVPALFAAPQAQISAWVSVNPLSRAGILPRQRGPPAFLI